MYYSAFWACASIDGFSIVLQTKPTKFGHNCEFHNYRHKDLTAQVLSALRIPALIFTAAVEKLHLTAQVPEKQF